jgi:hypothetical protein
MIPQQISLAVSTYERDYERLQRLIRSAQRHCAPGMVAEMVVVLKDEARHRLELDSILDQISDGSFPIRVVAGQDLRADLFDQDYPGWHIAQAVRLLLAREIRTEWYVLHDGKDQYVQDVDMSVFFDQRGRARGSVITYRDPPDDHVYPPEELQQVKSVRRSWYNFAYRMMSLDYFQNESTVIKSLSPLVLHTASINDLLDHLFQRMGDRWLDWFRFMPAHRTNNDRYHSVVSDAALISAYMTRKGLGDLYNTDLWDGGATRPGEYAVTFGGRFVILEDSLRRRGGHAISTQ